MASDHSRENVSDTRFSDQPSEHRTIPAAPVSTALCRVQCPHCREVVTFPTDNRRNRVECPHCGSQFHLAADIAPESSRGLRDRRLGPFELLEQLGAGQFGVVWKARDTRLDRIVALKIPRRETRSKQETEMFLREARAAAQLSHPHIVAVHDAGMQDDLIYIASDFVRGADLRQWLTQRTPTSTEAAQLCAMIGDALHHAHEAGVVHRDLKPANVMMDSAGQPKIMDFGLAKRDSGEATITIEGQILGTPAYMSPEQAMGEAHAADRRSDIYALGVMLYELLTGERPFRGERQMLIMQILTEEPRSPRRLNHRIPRDLETICLKCLEKNPERRYQTAADVAQELRDWLNKRPIKARPVGSLGRCWRWAQRRPAIAGMLLALAAVMLLGVSGVAWQWRRAVWQAGQTAEALEHVERQALQARQLLFVADMREIHRAWGNADYGRMQQLLDRHVPTVDEIDVRTFLWYHWQRKCHEFAATFPHGAPVQDIAVTHDGRWLATTSCPIDFGAEGLLKLWDLADARLVRTLNTGKRSGAVAFSPDSRQMATVFDRGVRIWDLAGELVHEISNDSIASAVALAFADSRTLVVGHTNLSVTVWDLPEQRMIRRLAPPEMKAQVAYYGARRWLKISPDGSWVAFLQPWAERYMMWNTRTGVLREAFGGEDQARDFAFSPDSRWLAVVGSAGDVAMWSIETGRRSGQWSAGAQVVEFMDHDRFVTAGNDRRVRIWRRSRNASIAEYVGHAGSVTTLSAPQDTGIVLSGGDDGVVRLWTLNGDEPQFETLGGEDVAVSPKGAFIARTPGARQSWSLWDSETGRMVHETKAPHYLRALRFTPDGEEIVTGGEDLVFWRALDGEILERWAAINTRAFDISRDGLRIASIDSNELLWLYPREDRSSARKLDGKYAAPSQSRTLVFSPTEDLLAVVNQEDQVVLWNYESEQIHARISGLPRTTCLTFSKDGRILALGGRDRKVLLWDVRKQTAVAEYMGHASSVRDLSFSPDGKTLAVAAGAELTCWNVVTGEPATTFPAPFWSSVAFSGDQRFLAATGAISRIFRVAEEDLLTAIARPSEPEGKILRPYELPVAPPIDMASRPLAETPPGQDAPAPGKQPADFNRAALAAAEEAQRLAKLAYEHRRNNEQDDVRSSCQQAIEKYREAVKLATQGSINLNEFDWCLSAARLGNMLGLLEINSGDPQSAVQTFDEALEFIQRATQNGIWAEASSLHGALLSNQGLALQDLGRDAEAIRRFDDAINRQKFAVKRGDKEQYRLYLRNHYAAKCESLAKLKEHERLAEAAKHLPEPMGAWEDWRHAAERLAVCLKLAREDQTLSQERREKLLANYRADLVAYLSKAVAAGAPIEQLRNDAAFEEFRDELQK